VGNSRDDALLDYYAKYPKAASEYTSSHFPDIPNYVAHMRTNERTLDDGSEGLFVEEFQSDRHQAGRKKGYVTTENEKQSASNRIKEIRKLQNELDPNSEQYKKLESEVPELARTISTDASGRIADAPFRTTWPIQLFKRALRNAVDGGKDWVGWTVGDTQNERFDLSKSVDSIEVDARDNTVHDVRVFEKSGSVIDLEVDGGAVKYGQFAGKRLDEVIGKDMADKILSVSNGTSSEFSGDGLKMGGSGMRGFYDNMLPKEVGKYVKQFGGKVEKADMTQSVEADIMSGEEAETGSIPIWKVNITPEMRKISQTGQMRFMPEGYKSHHDETLLNSAWNGKELDLNRPFKANESLPSLAMRTKWEEKPLVSKGDFDFNEKARVIFGKNKNGDDVTFKFDPKLLNPPNIVDFADVYTGEQIQYTIADRMSAVDGDMGGTLHPFLKNNDIVIEGPDGQKYVVGWGNNSATVGTKMRRKAKDGANVLMVYLMGNDAHQSNTRTVRLFDTQLENSSKPGHMIDIARAYSYIPIKEIKHASALKEVARIDGLLKKAKTLNKGSDYINKLKSDKNLAIKESQKFKVSAYETELAGIFRKVKSSQTRLDNGIGKQSTVDANIKELSDFASSKKGKSLIGEIPSQFIYEMTGTFDGRKSAVSQISNLKLYDFDGPALSAATADMESGDKNAIVTAIDLSNDQDFFMLYMGDDPKQINAMTSSEKAAAAKLKQNSNFVIHEAYDTLILSPLGGRRNLNSRMENALDAVPDSFQAVLDDRPNVKAQVGKTDAKGKLILSEDNLLNTVRDQQSVPLIYNPRK
jgi:hypothetical protein